MRAPTTDDIPEVCREHWLPAGRRRLLALRRRALTALVPGGLLLAGYVLGEIGDVLGQQPDWRSLLSMPVFLGAVCGYGVGGLLALLTLAGRPLEFGRATAEAEADRLAPPTAVTACAMAFISQYGVNAWAVAEEELHRANTQGRAAAAAVWLRVRNATRTLGASPFGGRGHGFTPTAAPTDGMRSGAA